MLQDAFAGDFAKIRLAGFKSSCVVVTFGRLKELLPFL